METNNKPKTERTERQNSPQDFGRKLAEKLKDEKIVPKPRWHFLLKDYVVWVVGIVSLLIGAAAVSVMIYFLKYNGWALQPKIHKSLMDFILMTLPYFWIIVLVLFVLILYYNFKQSKRGYRYPMWVIIIGSILASIILGELLFLVGLGRDIDDALGQQAPLYDKVINRQIEFWYNPDEGRLIGLVSARQTDHSFSIVDPHGQEWQVVIKEAENNMIAPRVYQPVDLIGQVSPDNRFQAWEIRIVHPGREFILRQRHASHGHFCSTTTETCPAPLPKQPFPRRPLLPGQD